MDDLFERVFVKNVHITFDNQGSQICRETVF